MEKNCPACKETKPLGEFPPHRTRGTQSRCRPCYANYQREYYRNRVATDYEYRDRKKLWRDARHKEKVEAQQRKIWDYLLDNPCVDCGEKDPVVLEFDHVRGQKKFSISSVLRAETNWKILVDEIAKCDVRCANCHRRKTAKQLEWYKWRNG